MQYPQRAPSFVKLHQAGWDVFRFWVLGDGVQHLGLEGHAKFLCFN